MDTKTSDALDLNKYVEICKAAIMEVQTNPKVVMDHETPLIMFASLFVPAIAIVLIRDFYESYTNVTTHLSLQQIIFNFNFSFHAYSTSSAVAICLLAYFYTPGVVFDNIMYIVPANSMGYFLISEWGTHPKFLMLKMIGDLGIRISCISIAVMSFCNESPISLVWYNIGLIAYVVGTVMTFASWIVLTHI